MGARTEGISRRSFLIGAAGAAAALAGAGAAIGPPRARGQAVPPELFSDLDAKILAGMDAYGIPGVAVAVYVRGQEYVKGYGVTNVNAPQPVDAGTLFRIGSTSKTLCGTTAMALVDRGEIDLDRKVRFYIPEFRAPRGAEDVTVRQVLNHTAGWNGYFYQDTGRGDAALADYVARVRRLRQLTTPGTTFGYNNAAISTAGLVIERASGLSYEDAVARYALAPIGMTSTFYYADKMVGDKLAAGHTVGEDGPVTGPRLFSLPRSAGPYGGAISSVADQIRYARFHLGDGRGRNGRRVMSARALRAMRSNPGPGGTLFVELDGVGVTWMVRPTAQGPKVIQHGGDVPGYHSGMMFVPDRDFAMTMLTNSEGGPKLLAEFFADDWALSRFAGVTNLPATPRSLSAAQLAPYAGRYRALQIGVKGPPSLILARMTPSDGGLLMEETQEVLIPSGERPNIPGGSYQLTFYKRDFVLLGSPSGQRSAYRANFVRDRSGRVAFFALGGRLFTKTS